MKRKSFLAVISLLAVMLVTSAYADTVNIIDLGEGNYTVAGDKLIRITGSDGQTILNAVNVIPSGGIILLSGDFKINSTINIKKPLTIRSLSESVLDGQGKTRVLRCQGQGIVLENLFITNGLSLEGGGINIDTSSIDITNCRIISNKGGIGGGINVKGDSSVKMTDCVISGDVSYLMGGGIFLLKGSMEIINCTVSGNEATSYGGGIYCSGGNLTLRDSRITGNTSKEKGGGIYNLRGTVHAWNCEISGNTPDDVSGSLIINGQDSSAETSSNASVNEPEAPVNEPEAPMSEESSGGGCSASGLGLVAMAVIFIRRKVIRHA